jgi:hypothetical protein
MVEAEALAERQQGSEAARAAYEAWFRRQVQMGIDALNAGDVVTAEEAEAEAEAWCAATLRRMRRMVGEADLDVPSDG